MSREPPNNDDPNSLQSLTEKLGAAFVNEMEEDALGFDEADLSKSSAGGLRMLASMPGALASSMYSQAVAFIARAQDRNERDEKQVVQITLADDREERKRKAEEEAEEEFEGSIDRVKAEEKREREREAWSKSTHRFGNVEMTGEEWGQLADKLKTDPVLRKWLLGKMKKDGMTDAEAHTMYSKVTLAMEMQSLPPDQWTPEMKALDQEMKNDPVLKKKVEGYTRDAHNAERSGMTVAADANAANASVSVSAGEVANAFDAPGSPSGSPIPAALNEYVAEAHSLAQRSNAAAVTKASSGSKTTDASFASAPNLADHFDEATAATVPLDGEKAKPQQIAANDLKASPPASSPGSGFGV